MNPIFENLSNELKMKKIRPSHQRLKVLEYLTLNPCHPTVDQIYVDLQKEVPTLSKATIYNTLSSFVDAGVVRVITIEGNETRYDVITENHGHFKCESCGKIYNFTVDIDSLKSADLNNFRINEKNLYFKGVCPGCLTKNENV